MAQTMAGDLTIAIDAMGGDHAPVTEIDGLAETLVRHPGVKFLVYGDEALIAPELERHPTLKDAVTLHHTPDRVTMDAKPSQVLRRGRTTSMWLALQAVKEGAAQVAVSCGNTGALMAMAKVQLRTMPGIDRPAIAAIWPTMRGDSIVLDVGANLDVDSKQLVDFAIMGEAFARAVLGIKRPSVGLLNVGSEDLKGTDAVREADRLIKHADLPIDYKGFIEGNDISHGTTDVVVTDGFTGNIALKTAEGTARLIAHYLSTSIRRSLFARIGALFAMGAFRVLRDKMDPRRVNGGVFLGLNGVVVKSHGGTDKTGFASAMDLAIDMGRSNFADEIASSEHLLADSLAVEGRDEEPSAGAPSTPTTSGATVS